MKTKIIFSIMMIAAFLGGCSKEEESKDYNMLKITAGDNAGFTFTFSPNLGFVSPVSENVNYVHLVLGNTENSTVSGAGIMSILFYDEGTGTVTIPSAQGQHANVGLVFESGTEFFTAELVTLFIESITDEHFTGRLTGEFSNISSGETMTVEMNIQMAVQPI